MKLVIVGNGIAGTTAARYVAERDPSVEIHIYTDEPYLYYPRPRLIDLIAGKVDVVAMPQYPPDWYQKRGIQVHLQQRITGILPETHQASLDDGTMVTYDKLLLANGANNFVPPFTGCQLEGIFTLRTMKDALTLQTRARSAAETVILGGGLLGLDLAMALCENKTNVTVVEMMPRLLPRQLDKEGAAVLSGILTKRGLHILTGDQCVQAIGPDHVTGLELKTGLQLPANLVAVSAGIRPNIQLAKAAGLACGRGITVDDFMQTSALDIFAIGDVAEFNGMTWGLIPIALAQAKTVSAAICGDMSAAYQPVVPSSSLKVTGIDLVSIGEVNPENDGFHEIRQENAEAGIYKKLVIRGGVVVGAILLGDRANVRAVNTLIEKKLPVVGQEERLLDVSFNPAVLG